MRADRIYPAIVVNDYSLNRYGTKIKEGEKCVETRMGRMFRYRGPVIICVGASNSVGPNTGKAICMVDLWKARDMTDDDVDGACIGNHPDRRAHLLRSWQYFSRDFDFAACAIKKNFQGIFSLRIPDGITLIPQPQIRPLSQYIEEYNRDHEGN